MVGVVLNLVDALKRVGSSHGFCYCWEWCGGSEAPGGDPFVLERSHVFYHSLFFTWFLVFSFLYLITATRRSLVFLKLHVLVCLYYFHCNFVCTLYAISRCCKTVMHRSLGVFVLVIVSSF